MPTNGPLTPSGSVVVYGCGMPDVSPWGEPIYPTPPTRELVITMPPAPAEPPLVEAITQKIVETIKALDDVLDDSPEDNRKFREMVRRLVRKKA